MADYDSTSFSSTGNGAEVIIDDKRPGLLRISGTFTGTIKLQVQKGNDLERTLSSDDTDWVDDSEYTEADVWIVESPRRLRWRTKASALSSGTAVAELNGG